HLRIVEHEGGSPLLSRERRGTPEPSRPRRPPSSRLEPGPFSPPRSELGHAAVHGEFVSVRERRVEGQKNGCLRDLFGTTMALHRNGLPHLPVHLVHLLL